MHKTLSCRFYIFLPCFHDRAKRGQNKLSRTRQRSSSLLPRALQTARCKPRGPVARLARRGPRAPSPEAETSAAARTPIAPDTSRYSQVASLERHAEHPGITSKPIRAKQARNTSRNVLHALVTRVQREDLRRSYAQARSEAPLRDTSTREA